MGERVDNLLEGADKLNYWGVVCNMHIYFRQVSTFSWQSNYQILQEGAECNIRRFCGGATSCKYYLAPDWHGWVATVFVYYTACSELFNYPCWRCTCQQHNLVLAIFSKGTSICTEAWYYKLSLSVPTYVAYRQLTLLGGCFWSKSMYTYSISTLAGAHTCTQWTCTHTSLDHVATNIEVCVVLWLL